MPNKDDMVTPIGQKVQSTLDAYDQYFHSFLFVLCNIINYYYRYKWIVYIQFNKGVFRVPLQFLLSDDEVPAPQPTVAKIVTPLDTPLSPLSNVDDVVKPSGPSIEELLGGVDKNACELKYEVKKKREEEIRNGKEENEEKRRRYLLFYL